MFKEEEEKKKKKEKEKEKKKKKKEEEEEEEAAALRRLNPRPPSWGCFPGFACIPGMLSRMSRDGKEKTRQGRAETPEQKQGFH